MVRVVVFGGRDFVDQKFLYFVLDRINAEISIKYLIQGYAKGADQLALKWANNRSIPNSGQQFKADWESHGKAAGPIRNKRMIVDGKPDFGIMFPGGRGTENMANQLKIYDIPVVDALGFLSDYQPKE